MKRVCDICNKEFETSQYNKKHCSKKCSNINKQEKLKQWFLKNKKEVYEKFEIKCDICSKIFFGKKNQKRCSNKCAHINKLQNINKKSYENNKEKYLKKRIEKTCDICNKLFLGDLTQKRCSIKCSKKAGLRRDWNRYLENKEENDKKIKTRNLKNIDHMRKVNREYAKLKRKNDVNFKIAHNCRIRIRGMLKVKNIKKSLHSRELIGCSPQFFKEHLENQFKPGMAWSNYNFYGWHIDHKIPLSNFDLTKEEEQKRAFHYSNCQPLWMCDNLVKSDKYESTPN